MTGDFAILSGRFETLAQPLGPGWVMRITATARDIQRIAFPFVARVAESPVDFVCVSVRGDLFEGYLRERPRPGDRLFVGYIKADVPTSIVYGRASGGTLVASQSEIEKDLSWATADAANSTCTADIKEVIRGWEQYKDDFTQLLQAERDKIDRLSDLIVSSFAVTDCAPLRQVGIVGHADNDYHGPAFEQGVSEQR